MVRRSAVDEAERRARRQVAELVDELRAARLAAGLSQAAVGRALRVSRQSLTSWERGDGGRFLVSMARWGAAVGLDIRIRSYLAGAPLRDLAQLRTLGRTRALIGERWAWRTEVPVSGDNSDLRAFDAVLTSDEGGIGLEVMTRLTDAQAQVRAAQLKQAAARLDRLVLVLSDTSRNRFALAAARPTVDPSFPMPPRPLLAALRSGRLPAANGILFV